MRYWLVKSEPGNWSWEDHCKAPKKTAEWDGVRNFLANKNMKAMKKGDCAFFYHSVKEKRIMGVVEVVKEHYPDPTDEKGKFGMVDFKVVCEAEHYVTLDEIKGTKGLEEMVLVKNSRLSVQPVAGSEWKIICKMAKIKA